MSPEQLKILEKLAAERNYGRGPNHAKQVRKLSLKIHGELIRLDILKKNAQDGQILNSAALLHDIGLPKEPHNEVAFDFLSREIPTRLTSAPLSHLELQTILYCILWHRGRTFAKRGNVDIMDIDHTKKMAAVLRVADALDRTLRQSIEDVTLRIRNQDLIITALSKYSIETEINRAKEKSDLMKETYALTEVRFE